MTTQFLIGLAVTALVVLSWLGGIAYLRRMRRALQATPAPAIHQPLDDSIEAWLAHAATLPDGAEPAATGGERDQNRLRELADRHFPHIGAMHPHVHLVGITGLEKRLLAWVCERTGLPNPFDALERITGNPDELRRVTSTFTAAHAEALAVIDGLCAGVDRLHERWTGAEADHFFRLVAEYLSELDALATDIGATGDTLRGLQAEAQLVEGTIVGLINLLIGSLGGFLVEAVATAGTMTPAVAAQAQVELTWVLKQVARALGRLSSIYANARHVLASVTGFRDLERLHARFDVAEIRKIAASIDPT